MSCPVVSQVHVNSANSPHQILPRYDLSTSENQDAEDGHLSTSRQALKGKQSANLHSSETPYIMKVKVEEDI